MRAHLGAPEPGNLVEALQGSTAHARVLLAHVLTQLTSGVVYVIMRGMVDEHCVVVESAWQRHALRS